MGDGQTGRQNDGHTQNRPAICRTYLHRRVTPPTRRTIIVAVELDPSLGYAPLIRSIYHSYQLT
jgi:hypothetical protein